jgi:DNA-binding cell septation regulator SpoVG
MQVKVSRLYRIDNNSGVIAFVDIVIDESLLIKGYRIIKGNKLFVSPPREKSKDGRWYNIIQAIGNETKDLISDTILNAYSTED